MHALISHFLLHTIEPIKYHSSMPCIHCVNSGGKNTSQELPASSIYIKKKQKDPNAPKKALTPYMLFANHIRNEVKESQEGISFQDITKEIGKRWRGLQPEQKKPYEIQHAALKEKYDIEKVAYLAAHPPAEKTTRGNSKPRVQKDHTGDANYVQEPGSGRWFKVTSNKGKDLSGAASATAATATVSS